MDFLSFPSLGRAQEETEMDRGTGDRNKDRWKRPYSVRMAESVAPQAPFQLVSIIYFLFLCTLQKTEERNKAQVLSMVPR